MEIKNRNVKAIIDGKVVLSTGGTTNFSAEQIVQSQRTMSQDTGWPLVRYARKTYDKYDLPAPWVFTHWDWGTGFITQKSSLESSWHSLNVTTQRGNNLTAYQVSHSGPALLADHSLYGFYSDSELSFAEQSLWTKGSEAVKIARPNKPTIDLSVTLGELRFGGLPRLLGSMAGRSKTLVELFRNGGKEYLNLQFGWLPLLRDIQSAVMLVSDGRRILEQYERDIDRLIRRRYSFPDQVTVDSTLALAPTHSSYKRAPGTPWGFPAEDHLTFQPSGQVPEQVNRTTTKTWFSGGFRFYHRSVPEALQELSLFEEKANLLLGTRLDPEVLWNLAPWTWLSDWFINFGDVVGNASALLFDDLVMQYGYLMRTTIQEQTISWPQGLFYRRPTSALGSVWERVPKGAYSQTISRVTKQRGRASPFGFGLTGDLTDQQLAIIAAVGISRR